MKYIGQYIKTLCPKVVVNNSKTTESVYYDMGYNFIIRLSQHIGWNEKGTISIVKSFNTDDFIIMVDTNPFPIIKTRKEVRTFIKIAYEIAMLSSLSKEHYAKKVKAEIEALNDWEKFWSKACQLTANARYLNTEQKGIIKEYFNKGIKGELMIMNVKKIKPITSLETIKKTFTKILETLKRDKS